MPVPARTNPGLQTGAWGAINFQPRRIKQSKPLSGRRGLFFELPSDSLPSLVRAPKSVESPYSTPTSKMHLQGLQLQLQGHLVRGPACFACKKLSEGNYCPYFALHPTNGLNCKWSIRQALGGQKLAIPTAHE